MDQARNDADRRIIDGAAVCEMLAITPRHLRELVYKRRIPVVRVGRLLRYDRAEIERWIERNTRRAQAS